MLAHYEKYKGKTNKIAQLNEYKPRRNDRWAFPRCRNGWQEQEREQARSIKATDME